MDPKIINFWTNFGTILAAILGPELAPKRDQKWDHFWNPLPPALRGPNDAILQIKRECCKSYCDWNYIRQKKGRDMALKGWLPGAFGKAFFRELETNKWLEHMAVSCCFR